MTVLIRKIHTYLGLANLTVLLVCAVAGVEATFSHGEPPRGPARFVEYRGPSNVSDLELGRDAARTLSIPLAPPVGPWAVHRDSANHVVVELWTVNGIEYVTVLEREGRLRVESAHTGFARFLNYLHSTTSQTSFPDWRLHAWGWYMEIGIWSLLAMTLSGLYLWLRSRLEHRWAVVFATGGTVAFAILYWGSRQ